MWWSTTSWPGRLKRAARCASAMARPTALEMPWPSGPVVASTPGVRSILGMPGRAAAPLPEGPQIVEREVVPRQVEQGVQEHRPVTGGQDEAVAVRPAMGRSARASDGGSTGHRPSPRRPSGRPGWPELARCTASAARNLIVSTASRSRSGCPINSSPGAAAVRAQTWTFRAVCMVRFGAQQACTGGRWLALFGLCAYGPCARCRPANPPSLQASAS